VNLILKWLSTFIIEKIFKASIEAIGNYFKKKEIERKLKEAQDKKNKIQTENRKKLDEAILKGNLDEIKEASENYINCVESINYGKPHN
jgi:hypothetical protein